MSRIPIYTISVDGQDISNTINPLLISMTIKEFDGDNASTLELELDDTDGQLILPNVDGSVSVALGWSDTGQYETFEGTISDVASSGNRDRPSGNSAMRRSAGSRYHGRTLVLSATSVNLGNSKSKQAQEAHLDNASFADAAQKFATAAGLTAVVGPGIASMQRPYWGIANESFLLWGARMAKEVGATFQVYGNNAVFIPKGSSLSASGASLTGINATWGGNLIAWSIAPVLSRASFGNFQSRFYDLGKATWNVVDAVSAGSLASAGATLVNKFKSATQDNAQAQAASNSAQADQDRGGADFVVIDGEPAAHSQATCTVSGIRPGVDGDYMISGVEHHLTRKSSFVTELTLNRPSVAADTRT